MEIFASLLSSKIDDLNQAIQIERSLNSVIQEIELNCLKENCQQANEFGNTYKQVCLKLLNRIDMLQRERDTLKLENSHIKDRAKRVREKFAVDIAHVLRDNGQLNEIKSLLRDISLKNQESTFKLSELMDENQKLKNQLNATESNSSMTAFNGLGTIFCDTGDPTILTIFSFLNTVEVLNIAQVNKYVFWKVDCLFGMNSDLVGPHWSTKPPCFGGEKTQPANNSASLSISANLASSSNHSVETSPSNAVTNELKEMATALTKKLTPTEMSAIIAWNSRLNTATNQLATMLKEKEELQSKLQETESVRDFLIEKLRSAEVAIKTCMGDVTSLKKTLAANDEMITYLDMRGQELEGINLEVTKKCERLQAAYDLQIGTHSHSERHLQRERQELIAKLQDLEINSKSQKKLLVKEVKKLKAQLESVTLERNHLKSYVTSINECLLKVGGGFPVGNETSVTLAEPPPVFPKVTQVAAAPGYSNPFVEPTSNPFDD